MLQRANTSATEHYRCIGYKDLNFSSRACLPCFHHHMRRSLPLPTPFSEANKLLK